MTSDVETPEMRPEADDGDHDAMTNNVRLAPPLADSEKTMASLRSLGSLQHWLCRSAALVPHDDCRVHSSRGPESTAEGGCSPHGKWRSTHLCARPHSMHARSLSHDCLETPARQIPPQALPTRDFDRAARFPLRIRHTLRFGTSFSSSWWRCGVLDVQRCASRLCLLKRDLALEILDHLLLCCSPLGRSRASRCYWLCHVVVGSFVLRCRSLRGRDLGNR